MKVDFTPSINNIQKKAYKLDIQQGNVNCASKVKAPATPEMMYIKEDYNIPKLLKEEFLNFLNKLKKFSNKLKKDN